MKLKLYYIILILLPSFAFTQNDQEILLEEIFTERKFSQDWVWGLNSMQDGLHYSIMNQIDNKTLTIEKYSYESGEYVEDILSSKDIDGLQFDN